MRSDLVHARQRAGHGHRGRRHLRALRRQATSNFGTADHAQVRQPPERSARYQPYVRFTVPALPTAAGERQAAPLRHRREHRDRHALRHEQHDVERDRGHLEQPARHHRRARSPPARPPRSASGSSSTCRRWSRPRPALQLHAHQREQHRRGGVLEPRGRQPAAARLTFPQPGRRSVAAEPAARRAPAQPRQFTTSPFNGTTTSARDEGGSAYVPAGQRPVAHRRQLRPHVRGRRDHERPAPGDPDRPTSPTRRRSATRHAGRRDAHRRPRVAELRPDHRHAVRDSRQLLQRRAVRPDDLPSSSATAQGKFQVEDVAGAARGHRPDRLGLACRSRRRHLLRQGPDDHARTTSHQHGRHADHRSRASTSRLIGMHFTPDGKDLLVTSHLNILYRVDPTTWTVRPGLGVRPLGVRLRRPAGGRGRRRPALRRPTARLPAGRRPAALRRSSCSTSSTAPPRRPRRFTASPTTGTAPVATTFTDRSTGVPDPVALGLRRRLRRSVDQNPVHTYSDRGHLLRHAHGHQRQGHRDASRSRTSSPSR